MKRIKTTIPSRTWRGNRRQPATHAVYLKMSYLEMERKRRIVEISNAQARIDLLTKRVAQIDREIEQMRMQQPAALPVSDLIETDAAPMMIIKY